MKVAIIVLALVAVAAAADSYKSGYGSGYKTVDYSAPAHYKFDWAVKDDYYNDFGQYESRDGDNTKGNYWVVLPDGRKQTVDYYVNGYSGFVADVKMDGYAAAPAYGKQMDYKPSY